jgi:hypothetical protein
MGEMGIDKRRERYAVRRVHHAKKASPVAPKPQCGTRLDPLISRRAAPSQLCKLLSTHELETNRTLISGARFAFCALAYCNIQSQVASAMIGMEKHKKEGRPQPPL